MTNSLRAVFDRVAPTGTFTRRDAEALVDKAGVMQGEGGLFDGFKRDGAVDALMDAFGGSGTQGVSWEKFKAHAAGLIPGGGSGAGMQKAIDALYAKADINHDNKLSERELTSHVAQLSAGQSVPEFRGKAAAKLAMELLPHAAAGSIAKHEMEAFADSSGAPKAPKPATEGAPPAPVPKAHTAPEPHRQAPAAHSGIPKAPVNKAEAKAASTEPKAAKIPKAVANKTKSHSDAPAAKANAATAKAANANAPADIKQTLDTQRLSSTTAIAAGRPAASATPVKGYQQGPSIQQLGAGAELKLGHKGESVRWMQEQLNAAGANPPLAVDGKLGRKTEAALKQFQQSRGCTDSAGVFGKTTSEAFDKETLVDPVIWKEMQSDAISEGRTSLGTKARVNDANLQKTADEDYSARGGPVQNGVVPMSQGDYGGRIGNSNKSIRQVGCMMTSMAMASTAITGNTNMNPAQANELIKGRGGFVGASLVPGTAAGALGMKLDGRIGTHNSSPRAMKNRVDASLDSGKPVVLGVDYRAGSGGSGNGTGVDHWITITGRNTDGSYNAVDSAGGKTMTLRPGAKGLLEGNSPSGAKHYVAKEMIFLSKG